MKVGLHTTLVCAVGSLSAGYMMSVTAHVVPLSAATFEVRKVTDRLVEPWFRQRWSFFAPAPPQVNTSTMAQARYIDDGGRVRNTGWFDVSAYLDAESKHRPLAPSRRYRAAANIERALLGSAVARQTSEGRQFAPHPAAQSEVDARNHAVQRRYGELVLRVAADVLDQWWEPPEKLLSLQARVVATPISAFGERGGRRRPPPYLVWESGWRAAPGTGAFTGP